jgi:hypothetical protein
MTFVADHRRPGAGGTWFMLGETIKAANKFQPGVVTVMPQAFDSR